MSRTSLKTSNSEIVKAVEDHLAGLEEAHRRGIEFAKSYGVEDGAYLGGPNPFGEWKVFGLATKTKPERGDWKNTRGGLAPRANSEEVVRVRDINLITAHPDEIPGLPFNVHHDHKLMETAFFILNGTVYANAGTPLVEDALAAGWEEILTSEYEAAVGAHARGDA